MAELPDHLRRLAQSVAQHEFGHYVVARVLGFRTHGVTIEILSNMGGHRGGAAVSLAMPIGSLDEMASYLARRIQVLFAGAAAETLKPFDPTKSVNVPQAVAILREMKGAEQDHAKATELIHALRSVRYPKTDPTNEEQVQKELSAIDLELWEKAVSLVNRHYDTIMGLAGNLSSRLTDQDRSASLGDAELSALKSVQDLPSAPP